MDILSRPQWPQNVIRLGVKKTFSFVYIVNLWFAYFIMRIANGVDIED